MSCIFILSDLLNDVVVIISIFTFKYLRWKWRMSYCSYFLNPLQKSLQFLFGFCGLRSQKSKLKNWERKFNIFLFFFLLFLWNLLNIRHSAQKDEQINMIFYFIFFNDFFPEQHLFFLILVVHKIFLIFCRRNNVSKSKKIYLWVMTPNIKKKNKCWK